jgi:hypothetical protein
MLTLYIDTIIVLMRVFVAKGTCLPSHCLAVNRGIQFTESLPSNDKRDTHRHTD